MPHPEHKTKFAVSNGPVNRRTASVAQRQPPVPARPQLLNRLRASHARHRLGTPLALRLQASADTPNGRIRASTRHILQAIGGALGATGLFLGMIANTAPLVGASAASLLGVGIWIVLERRRSGSSGALAQETFSNWVAPGDVERLDAAMETLAAHCPPPVVHALSGLKDTIARCVRALGNSQKPGLAASDDRLFVGEAIRRYIPDSLLAYSQVPIGDRETLLLDQGKTAVDLLLEQLALLTDQLQKREVQWGQLAAESLLQQQRFLAAKTRSNAAD